MSSSLFSSLYTILIFILIGLFCSGSHYKSKTREKNIHEVIVWLCFQNWKREQSRKEPQAEDGWKLGQQSIETWDRVKKEREYFTIERIHVGLAEVEEGELDLITRFLVAQQLALDGYIFIVIHFKSFCVCVRTKNRRERRWNTRMEFELWAQKLVSLQASISLLSFRFWFRSLKVLTSFQWQQTPSGCRSHQRRRWYERVDLEMNEKRIKY